MGLFNKSKSNAAIDHVGALLDETFEAGSFHFDGDSAWIGRLNSTAVVVKVWAENEIASTVHISARVIQDVKITPELCYALLTENRFRVGRWEVEMDDDGSGKGVVMLGVDLINWEGSLDAVELNQTINLVAESADEIDEELVARFGGTTTFSN